MTMILCVPLGGAVAAPDGRCGGDGGARSRAWRTCPPRRSPCGRGRSCPGCCRFLPHPPRRRRPTPRMCCGPRGGCTRDRFRRLVNVARVGRSSGAARAGAAGVCAAGVCAAGARAAGVSLRAAGVRAAGVRAAGARAAGVRAAGVAPPVPAPPVFAPTVFAPPVFAPPVFAPPVFAPPVSRRRAPTASAVRAAATIAATGSSAPARGAAVPSTIRTTEIRRRCPRRRRPTRRCPVPRDPLPPLAEMLPPDPEPPVALRPPVPPPPVALPPVTSACVGAGIAGAAAVATASHDLGKAEAGSRRDQSRLEKFFSDRSSSYAPPAVIRSTPGLWKRPRSVQTSLHITNRTRLGVTMVPGCAPFFKIFRPAHSPRVSRARIRSVAAANFDIHAHKGQPVRYTVSMRVVSLLPGGTELVCALQQGHVLVGRSHERDDPPWVRRLPVLSGPTFDVSGSSGEIDHLVRQTLQAGEALSAMTCHGCGPSLPISSSRRCTATFVPPALRRWRTRMPGPVWKTCARCR